MRHRPRWMGAIWWRKIETMTFTIFAGRHRARPWRFNFWWRKTSFTWVVKFTESCRYDLQGPDQLDTNKLIGIGYLPGHHTDSARFGWRYDAEKDMIELSAYCYVGGRRVIQHIGFCEIGKWYRIELFVTRWAYHLSLAHTDQTPIGETEIKHNHNRKFQYRLGTYFGGNRVTPRTMKIQIETA